MLKQKNKRERNKINFLSIKYKTKIEKEKKQFGHKTVEILHKMSK